MRAKNSWVFVYPHSSLSTFKTGLQITPRLEKIRNNANYYNKLRANAFFLWPQIIIASFLAFRTFNWNNIEWRFPTTLERTWSALNSPFSWAFNIGYKPVSWLIDFGHISLQTIFQWIHVHFFIDRQFRMENIFVFNELTFRFKEKIRIYSPFKVNVKIHINLQSGLPACVMSRKLYKMKFFQKLSELNFFFFCAWNYVKIILGKRSFLSNNNHHPL